LFKKFAYDFAENYKTDPIRITDDAKAYLKAHRFPGNIRQLKNLAEQVSILNVEREVNAGMLESYLPRLGSHLPALIDQDQANDNYTERDILYKVLFDMKADMADLKKLVFKMLDGEENQKEILEEHKTLFEKVESYPAKIEEPQVDAETTPTLVIAPSDETFEEEEIEDITHEMDFEDSLLLEKKEKEMIIRALRKNNNKRKYAAADLGISERTLYRKIKQYEIEKI
ncbi:MAG: helix-turn-helix domain-containing protein, partial [Bacteroidota bacterium]